MNTMPNKWGMITVILLLALITWNTWDIENIQDQMEFQVDTTDHQDWTTPVTFYPDTFKIQIDSLIYQHGALVIKDTLVIDAFLFVGVE